MGIFSGTLSYARYFVEGDLPRDFKNIYPERIQHYAIRDLSLDSEEEEMVGWTNAHSILDRNFTPETLFFNEYIIFSLRIDKWKIPPTLLKAHIIEAERKFRQEFDKEHLSNREKKLIKEQVKIELKRKLLPSITVYDLCWQPDAGILRFWNLSPKINQLMIELFEKTFRLSLVPLSPYTLAERAQLTPEELDRVASLESIPFSEHRMTIPYQDSTTTDN